MLKVAYIAMFGNNEKHLIENGHNPVRRLWRRLGDKDELDGVWEEYYRQQTQDEENVCIDKAMDIEGWIGNAYVIATPSGHVEKGTHGV